jgi:hypothetical protein
LQADLFAGESQKSIRNNSGHDKGQQYEFRRSVQVKTNLYFSYYYYRTYILFAKCFCQGIRPFYGAPAKELIGSLTNGDLFRWMPALTQFNANPTNGSDMLQ